MIPYVNLFLFTNVFKCFCGRAVLLEALSCYLSSFMSKLGKGGWEGGGRERGREVKGGEPAGGRTPGFPGPLGSGGLSTGAAAWR